METLVFEYFLFFLFLSFSFPLLAKFPRGGQSLYITFMSVSLFNSLRQPCQMRNVSMVQETVLGKMTRKTRSGPFDLVPFLPFALNSPSHAPHPIPSHIPYLFVPCSSYFPRLLPLLIYLTPILTLSTRTPNTPIKRKAYQWQKSLEIIKRFCGSSR